MVGRKGPKPGRKKVHATSDLRGKTMKKLKKRRPENAVDLDKAVGVKKLEIDSRGQQKERLQQRLGVAESMQACVSEAILMIRDGLVQKRVEGLTRVCEMIHLTPEVLLGASQRLLKELGPRLVDDEQTIRRYAIQIVVDCIDRANEGAGLISRQSSLELPKNAVNETQKTVSGTGSETGTGKEVVARTNVDARKDEWYSLLNSMRPIVAGHLRTILTDLQRNKSRDGLVYTLSVLRASVHPIVDERFVIEVLPLLLRYQSVLLGPGKVVKTSVTSFDRALQPLLSHWSAVYFAMILNMFVAVESDNAGVVGTGVVGTGVVGAGPVGTGPVGAGAVGAGAVGTGVVGTGVVGAGPVGTGVVGAGVVGAGPVVSWGAFVARCSVPSFVLSGSEFAPIKKTSKKDDFVAASTPGSDYPLGRLWLTLDGLVKVLENASLRAVNASVLAKLMYLTVTLARWLVTVCHVDELRRQDDLLHSTCEITLTNLWAQFAKFMLTGAKDKIHRTTEVFYALGVVSIARRLCQLATLPGMPWYIRRSVQMLVRNLICAFDAANLANEDGGGLREPDNERHNAIVHKALLALVQQVYEDAIKHPKRPKHTPSVEMAGPCPPQETSVAGPEVEVEVAVAATRETNNFGMPAAVDSADDNSLRGAIAAAFAGMPLTAVAQTDTNGSVPLSAAEFMEAWETPAVETRLDPATRGFRADCESTGSTASSQGPALLPPMLVGDTVCTLYRSLGEGALPKRHAAWLAAYISQESSTCSDLLPRPRKVELAAEAAAVEQDVFEEDSQLANSWMASLLQ
ncbi:hypothetical protein GNI_115740 [Gregarina niphandrodes]|uniref:Uncharacterized protein n=1 Tax=Gregarina niphandrodes TaxID=110365 RepID=A0A023B313_GRENI|nr:hypothetical protein GNI_115740 [Gregarina niphandrodes]EZG55246.1 hypothetical protein GNI_115740 [Gregarina niphandrodes]|eukprot:XP_011131697.1 hypothetical protein GNI_115740 [Gregarina niphandrodes]